MLKKGLLLSLLGAVLVLPALAQSSEECEPAVDMIESNDAVNRIGECDYSDQGLSGWLSGLRDERESGEAASEQAQTPAADGAAVAAAPTWQSVSDGSVSDGLQYVQRRFALLQQAAQECAPQAAQIGREQVLHQGSGSLKIELRFTCVAAQ